MSGAVGADAASNNEELSARLRIGHFCSSKKNMIPENAIAITPTSTVATIKLVIFNVCPRLIVTSTVHRIVPDSASFALSTATTK
jgi:hypothetical protein